MCYLEENQYCIIPQDGKKMNVFFDQKAVISKVKKEQILSTVLMLDKQKSNIYLCKHLRKKIYKSMTVPVPSEFSCVSVIRQPTLQSQTLHRGLGKTESSWEKLAVSMQTRGSAITPSLTAAILKVPTSQNPSMTYLSFNSTTRLWSFYVSHLGLEAVCVVMSGG